MFSKQTKPYELLTTIGELYEVTLLEDIALNGEQKTHTIHAEFRGWEHDEKHGFTYAVLLEIGANRAEDYYIGDILSSKPSERPLKKDEMFFSPFKGRKLGEGKIDIYRNLHTNNGYSIRCSKTGLVLAHCSTVHLKNARFHVSESGRLKTVKEQRKRVHAFIRGELIAYNVLVPKDFVKVIYNPYYTSLFMEAETNTPILEAEEVICCGKYAYAKRKSKECNLFDLMGDTHE